MFLQVFPRGVRGKTSNPKGQMPQVTMDLSPPRFFLEQITGCFFGYQKLPEKKKHMQGKRRGTFARFIHLS